MSSPFPHILADCLPSLVIDDGECPCCEVDGKQLYNYFGSIVDPAIAKDAALAQKSPEIECLCAQCIVSGGVRKFDLTPLKASEVDELPLLNRQEIERAYHATPDVMFMQRPEWPVCCGQLTQYVGADPIAGTAFEDYRQWHPQDPMTERFQLGDYFPLDKLEVMHTMALFRCLACTSYFWNFQYSGLLWPGPLAPASTVMRPFPQPVTKIASQFSYRSVLDELAQVLVSKDAIYFIPEAPFSAIDTVLASHKKWPVMPAVTGFYVQREDVSKMRYPWWGALSFSSLGVRLSVKPFFTQRKTVLSTLRQLGWPV